MAQLPTGQILLLIAAVLIYFGLAQRVLDRMRLTDRTALLFVLFMIAGSFVNIPLSTAPIPLSINVGGALVPIGISLYLIITADTALEKVRGSLSALVTGAVVYGLSTVLPAGPEERTLIEPSYLFAIVAGLVAYLAGRSRRSAFIAGTMGIVLSDLAHYVAARITGTPTVTAIGGAGAFDTVVVAGVLAVLLAEVVGETREYLGGGPKKVGRREDLTAPRMEASEMLLNEETLDELGKPRDASGKGKRGAMRGERGRDRPVRGRWTRRPAASVTETGVARMELAAEVAPEAPDGDVSEPDGHGSAQTGAPARQTGGGRLEAGGSRSESRTGNSESSTVSSAVVQSRSGRAHKEGGEHHDGR